MEERYDIIECHNRDCDQEAEYIVACGSIKTLSCSRCKDIHKAHGRHFEAKKLPKVNIKPDDEEVFEDE